jgi:hypothetical protein
VTSSSTIPIVCRNLECGFFSLHVLTTLAGDSIGLWISREYLVPSCVSSLARRVAVLVSIGDSGEDMVFGIAGLKEAAV